MSYYWKLVYGSWKDLKEILIPPEPKNLQGQSPIDVVKQRWDGGQPIHTSNGSVAASDVRSFDPTNKVYGSQALLEAGARAFKEPIYTDMGSTTYLSKGNGSKRFFGDKLTEDRVIEVKYTGVLHKWVKQIVTQSEWDKWYSQHHSYRKLSTDGGMVTVAFVKASHDINPVITPECTDKEVEMLNKRD